MSRSRACGSRQPSRRPNFSCQAAVPGVSLPTSFLSQRAQPTSAAFERSRAAGTTRPLMYRRSLSVWKQNWVLIHARLLLGTYSSQIAGGSTTWLSQSNTGKSLRTLVVMVGLLAARAFTPRKTRLLCEPARRLSMTHTANAAGLERFSLSGRVVLITGSTRGLGLEIAGGMAAAGAVTPRGAGPAVFSR